MTVLQALAIMLALALSPEPARAPAAPASLDVVCTVDPLDCHGGSGWGGGGNGIITFAADVIDGTHQRHRECAVTQSDSGVWISCPDGWTHGTPPAPVVTV